MYPIIILAGGLGTRLRPITETIPKALVPVNGRAFIDYQLDYLHQQGIKKVILCIGYLGHLITEHVGDGSKFGLEVIYSLDGEYFLGTAGAIKKALPLVGEHFFVLYGDSFLPIDFTKVMSAYNNNALMTVVNNADSWDKSNVKFMEDKRIYYNKLQPTKEMRYIDYGLLLMPAKLFSAIPEDDFCDLADMLHQVSKQNALQGYLVSERFYEVGSMSGLRETENYFKTRNIQHELCATTFK